MKRQAGLTIIKLMVLLLIAGFIGLVAINSFIRHRCLNDPGAHMCAQRTSTSVHESYFLLTITTQQQV
jgi:Tfp pilus assembly protein PilE